MFELSLTSFMPQRTSALSDLAGRLAHFLRFTGRDSYALSEPSGSVDVVNRKGWKSIRRDARGSACSVAAAENAYAAPEPRCRAIPVAYETDPPVTTLVLFGSTPRRIAAVAGLVAEWMVGEGAGVGLAEVAHTLNHHRAWHACFATVCARHRVEAVAQLSALAAGRPADGVMAPHERPRGSGYVFVYPGAGSQWPGMGRRLMVDEPEFAAAVTELDPIFVERVGFSLHRVLIDGEPVVGETRGQAVLLGLQLALTELWRSYGMIPDAVVGHSAGEVTAAVVAGALSLTDGLRVIAARSRSTARWAGQGALASLELSAATTAELIVDYPDICIAGIFSPRQTLVAGPPTQIEGLIGAVGRQNGVARRVNVDVAAHSPSMDSVLPELREALADLVPREPVVPFVSTVTGGAVTPVLDAEYWAANLRQPVQFCQAISVAGQDNATFIEISADPTLTRAITQTLGNAHSVGTLRRDGDDTVSFHTNLNATHGVYPPQTPHPRGPHPVLPTLPPQRTHLWMSAARARSRTEAVESGTRAAQAADLST